MMALRRRCRTNRVVEAQEARRWRRWLCGLPARQCYRVFQTVVALSKMTLL